VNDSGRWEIPNSIAYGFASNQSPHLDAATLQRHDGKVPLDMSIHFSASPERLDELCSQQLSEAELAERLAINPQDIEKVEAWLRSAGFTAIKDNETWRYVSFKGSPTLAEQAFRTSLYALPHRSGDSQLFVNGTNLSVPSAFSKLVSSISGLSRRGPGGISVTGVCNGHFISDFAPYLIESSQSDEVKAAGRGKEGIEEFVKSGGKFTDRQDGYGLTSGMAAAWKGAEAINAFSRAGGKFSDQPTKHGDTAAILSVRSPDATAAIPAFFKAGGRFSTKPNYAARTAAMFAAGGGPAIIQVFAAAGGKFTSQSDAAAWSAATLASAKGPEATEAYDRAITQQGGLIYISDDDEFSAVKNQSRIASFVGAGGRFDFRQNKQGLTAAMLAVSGGPEVIRAFAAAGGKFSDQHDENFNTAESMASREPGRLQAFLEAVKQQGGLVTPMPTDQYAAAREGALAISVFANGGGRFTDDPSSDDLTSAMIAASGGADAIVAFSKAGGRFTDRQNNQGYTAAMTAIISGPDAIRAFARAGGHFTDQQDYRGKTAAIWSVTRNQLGWPSAREGLKFPPQHMDLPNREKGDTIRAFSEAGGHFDDHQDHNGMTAGMDALLNSPGAVKAFYEAGGRFTDQQTKSGLTAEIFAMNAGPETITAFGEAGGHFSIGQPKGSQSVEWMAASRMPEWITAFSKAGGKFTDHYYGSWTTEMIASNMSEFAAQEEAARLKQPISDELRAKWKAKDAERDKVAAIAYQEAIGRQGSLVHFQ
jgi:ankyrin repeat protein